MKAKNLTRPNITAEISTVGQFTSMFTTLVNMGIEAWTKAGKLLVDFIEEHPNGHELILNECPSISIETLLSFERIGRREVSPKLLIDSSVGARKLSTMPFDEQQRYSVEPIEVLVGYYEGGKPMIERKMFNKLSAKEVRMVFGTIGVRSVETQTLTRENPADKPKSQPAPKMQVLGHFKIIKRGILIQIESIDKAPWCSQTVTISGEETFITIKQPSAESQLSELQKLKKAGI